MKVFLFDIGNVLCDFDYNKLLNIYEEISKKSVTIDSSWDQQMYTDVEAGKISDQEYVELVNHLKNIGIEISCANFYKSPSEGFEGEDFINCALGMKSKLDFDDLNKELKKIENLLKRDRSKPKFSSRTIDIDIILVVADDDIQFVSDELEKYNFVGIPINEIISPNLSDKLSINQDDSNLEKVTTD